MVEPVSKAAINTNPRISEKPGAGITRLGDSQQQADLRGLLAGVSDFANKIGLQDLLTGKNSNLPNLEVKYG